ncbi:adenylate kinase family protein [Hyperthermus butylicus]|uniref:Putative adenylate kinase n=1 Tax=Hyperthermus butylicus (strain DSM 5456 / JCM 9403 / PLM1-5) TaxID=415426 RepID=A2BK31_HYPBU|nr:AAA family ATPase [Hyperthermus butylicus]ABM80342.1 putative nucleotide kinase [Hyperthermus butylicus DSM 5456]
MERGLLVIAGTPGAGKSVLGSRLARLLKLRFTTISWLVLYNGLWVEYDAQRRSFVIDYEGLLKLLTGLRGYIVETHWLEPFEELGREHVEFIVVVRCNPLILLERLKRRGWPARKIIENVEAELVGVIASEARSLLDKGIPVFEVVTSNTTPDKLALEVLEAIRLRKTRCCIDWLSVLREEELSRLISSLEELGGEVGSR